MHSKVSSDWLPSYVKVMQLVFENIKKGTGTFWTALILVRFMLQLIWLIIIHVKIFLCTSVLKDVQVHYTFPLSTPIDVVLEHFIL
jgi:hypothetical protein